MRPYNTRHKTLSLHSLGIHVPGSHAGRATPANRTSSSSASPDSMASPASVSKADQPPSKRLKRAFSESSSDDEPTLDRLPKRRDDAVKLENTPPLSPSAERPSIEMSEDEDSAPKAIDMEGINDEIVEAVIVQLQNTRNRPHLVKELAAVLMPQLKIVQQSANPCAIISSRLATYLKRASWSALAPCPLAKELESVHPRRTYFYLTTCPHQPLPDPSQPATLNTTASRAIITPSTTPDADSASDEDSSDDLDRRRALSPSPEVDLSSPELDDIDDDFAMPTTPIGSFSRGGFYMSHLHARPHHHHPTHHHHAGAGGAGAAGRHGHGHGRAASPPLEGDEREFTQTADGLQRRGLLTASSEKGGSGEGEQPTTAMDIERDEGSLFGGAVMAGSGAAAGALLSAAAPQQSLSTASASAISFVSSPAIRPSTTMSLANFNFGRKDGGDGGVDSWAKFEGMLEWDRSPESIELEELDGLLDDY